MQSQALPAKSAASSRALCSKLAYRSAPSFATPRKAKNGPRRDCEVALAAMEDATALARAFATARAVFILPPPVFDPEPGYPEAQTVIDSVVTALAAAKPARVLLLSTIGADAKQDNLLSQRTMMEAAPRGLALPLTILRPAWFIDNAAWDMASARDTGVIHSFLLPTDKAIPMIAAKDVGRVAADLIQQCWTGTHLVELEGPRRVSPNHLADAFASVFGTPVRAAPVPREIWEELFRTQGMRNPSPRMRMLDGFNEGWIEFENKGAKAIKGGMDVLAVISSIVAGANA